MRGADGNIVCRVNADADLSNDDFVDEVALETQQDALALTNAIFRATGRRIRRLPIRDQLRQ